MSHSVRKHSKSAQKNQLFEKKSATNNIVWTIACICIFIVCFVQVFAVFWMLYTSLKSDLDLFISVFALPKKFHWENYESILYLLRMEVYITGRGYVQFGLWDMLKNSVMMSVFMPMMGSIVTVCTAYILSKFRFPGRDVLIALNIFVMIFPIVGNLASALKINTMIGRYDNLALMCLLGHHPFGFNLLIYLNMFNGIDNTYMEAAKIDGAGNFTIFLKIMTPMILPTVVVFYILAVLGTWNDYNTPLVWLPSYPNLALGMYDFQYNSSKYAATLPQVLAGFVLMSIPSVLFFSMNQKLITSKMMVGGLKG